MINFVKYLVWFSLVLRVYYSDAQKVIVLDEHRLPVSICQDAQYFEDVSGQIPFQEIARLNFKPNLAKIFDFGHSTSTYWLRFAVKNSESNPASDLAIFVGAISLHTCDLFVVNPRENKVLEQRLGNRFPYKNRLIDSPFLTHPIDVSDTLPRIYYLKIRGVNSLKFDVRFEHKKEIITNTRNYENAIILYFGGLIVMIFYNLMLFYGVRDRSYFFYVLYLTFTLCVHLCMYGIGYKYLWGNLPDWMAFAQNFFLGLTLSSAILFAYYFLNITLYFPKLRIIYFILFFIGLIISGISIFNNSAHLTSFTALIVLPAVTLTWSSAWLIYRKGYRPALFYVMGWLVLFLTVILFSFSNLGIIPNGLFINFLMPFGTIVEMMLFSFGLGYRINLFRKEKNQRQKEIALLKSESKNNALRSQMNPHFIFNCMNTIEYYILVNQQEKASNFLQNFSLLIRHVLENSRHETVPLSTELAVLELYISLERERSEHNFDYKIIMDETVSQHKIQLPPMLLQPFVENAILHGMRHLQDRRGLLEIFISEENTNLRVIIKDNGIGREASKIVNQKKNKQTESLGMQVSEDRILSLKDTYGANVSLTILDVNSSGTEVRILLPLLKTQI